MAAPPKSTMPAHPGGQNLDGGETTTLTSPAAPNETGADASSCQTFAPPHFVQGYGHGPCDVAPVVLGVAEKVVASAAVSRGRTEASPAHRLR